MKSSGNEIQAQFIVDKAGKKTGVILDIETFYKLIDELEDFYLTALGQAALKEAGEVVSHDEMKQQYAQKKSK